MTSTIHPDLTMAELLEVYPGAQRALFRQYHIGGCSSCGFQPGETLAGVCNRNENLSVSEVIDYLEKSQADDEKSLISPTDAATALETGEAKFLDIRTREEYEAVHIAGSHLFSQELLAEITSTWDKDALLVIVDHQGKRTLDAAAYFQGHGFNNVRGLTGGIDAWSEQINPDLPRYHLE
ncbi:MAG: rhodanese-like domain-containing protein [Chthoniobacterales bacterium]